MPAPPAAPARLRGAPAVVFWTLAVLAYAIGGALYPPAFLLGFWESMPALLLFTWLAVRVLPALGRRLRG